MFSMPNKRKSSTLNNGSFRLLNISSLKDRVRKALDDSNMNAAALARKANVSRGTVSLWLNGQTQQIEGENLTRAASALGVSDGKGLTEATKMTESDFSTRFKDIEPMAGASAAK